MKTFRKALSIILGLAIMLSCVAGMQVSVAAEETATETAALVLKVGDAVVDGSVVTVPVEVTKNDGFRALTVEVGYEADVLDLELPTEENPAKNANFTTAKDVAVTGPEVNPFRLMWAFAEEKTNVTATGTIATLTFNVLDDSVESTDITLNVTEAWDVEGNEVTTAAEDGVVEFVKECAHTETEWVIDTDATKTTQGSKHLYCNVCNTDLEGTDKVIPQHLAFSGGALRLESSISILFQVKAAYLDYGYEDLYVKFDYVDKDGVEQSIIVTEYETSGTALLFVFKEILPQQMNEDVWATLYGTYDGELYEGTAANRGSTSYSIKTYANSKLKGTDAGLKTLVVDLLNYGSAMQNYTSYKTDNLANASLTDEQKALATADRTLTSCQNLKYNVIDNPSVSWKGAGLALYDSVMVNLTIQTSDLTGLELVAVIDDTVTQTYSDLEFTPVDGYTDRYTVRYTGLAAKQFSSPVAFTFYKDGVAVSNSVLYSIESYCKSKESDTSTLGPLVKSIMRYGDAAAAYFK